MAQSHDTPCRSFFPEKASCFFASGRLIYVLLRKTQHEKHKSIPTGLSAFCRFIYILVLLPTQRGRRQKVRHWFFSVYLRFLARSVLLEMQIEASNYRNVELVVYNAMDNSSRQVSQIRKLISQNVDVLIISLTSCSHYRCGCRSLSERYSYHYPRP